MSDERKDRPSASGIEKMALCPGSWNASRGISNTGGADATAGTATHAVLAGDTDEDTLTASQVLTLETIGEIEREIIREVFGTIPTNEAIREERLWFHDETTLRFSGQLDFLMVSADIVSRDVALIIDYKTGHKASTDAAVNWQLAAQAVLVDCHYALDEVVVAIIQPNCRPRYTLARYNDHALHEAEAAIMAVLDAAAKPDATRIPGLKQCMYCPAKPHCPEAQGIVASMSLSEVHQTNGVVVTGDILAQRLEIGKLAKLIIASNEADAKRILADDPNAIPGWGLKPGAVKEICTDPSALFARFVELGGTPAQFMPCVAIGKAKLKEAVRVITSTKGRALESEIIGLYFGLTESKQSAPSLERIEKQFNPTTL